MKYFLVVGEASGDLHASNLMRAIQSRDPEAKFQFFGGDRMAAVGGHLWMHYRELAFMGVVAVVLHAKRLLSHMKLCRKAILEWKPDVLILVDYAGFNLRIAAQIKKSNPDIPIHFYISPKLWAWKSYRIQSFRAYIDKLYVIFPFEPAFFEQHSYPVQYVGNPTVDSVSEYVSKAMEPSAFRLKHKLDDRPILAVLPGSRSGEVRSNLNVMLDVLTRAPNVQPVVAGSPGLDESFYDACVRRSIPVVFGQTYELLHAAHAALVTSGTATLETGLFRVPQVVCFAVSGGRLPNWFFKRFMHVPYISLVNLIADRLVVPECMGANFTVEKVSAALLPLLEDSPERRDQLAGYESVARRLGAAGTADRTASAICSALK